MTLRSTWSLKQDPPPPTPLSVLLCTLLRCKMLFPATIQSIFSSRDLSHVYVPAAGLCMLSMYGGMRVLPIVPNQLNSTSMCLQALGLSRPMDMGLLASKTWRAEEDCLRYHISRHLFYGISKLKVPNRHHPGETAWPLTIDQPGPVTT